jgi:enoyl-CoA hydratase/carnithine racemase
VSIAIERTGAVAVVVIDRADRANAIDLETATTLSTVFDELTDDDSVGAVVLTAAGDRVFCAGMELDAVRAGQAGAINAVPGGFAGIVRREFPKPLIAAVNGAAMGGGFEIVLACDLVVAAEHARFGLPEVKLGLFAASGGAVRLVLRIPPARAMEYLLLGDPITAADAQALGLVNYLAPAESLRSRAVELAERAAANAPLALAASKRIARTALALGEDAAWDINTELAALVTDSEDAKEGLQATAERRQPRWTGK